MLNNAPIINLLAPFFGAFSICALGFWRRQIAQPIAIISLSVSLISSLASLMLVAQNGFITYTMGGWSAPFGIVFGLDGMNAIVVTLIHLVALLSVIHAGPSLKDELGNVRHFYYCLLLLFITGITGITQTADAFNLYVLIEVASLTGYALIAVGQKRSAHAALNYLLMGSIGATFYLLGVGYLYIKTGTLNMHDIHHVLVEQNLINSATIQVAAIMLMLGLFLKMALFPFHGWLPNAYTFSPLCSASVMAPLMTKVMIYVMIRFMLTVFGLEHVMSLIWSQAIPYLAVIAILYGSFMALAQTNLRRLVTYIIVAEVGYMVGAAWLGNENGVVASSFHIISDSIMTLCLMLSIGALIHKHNIKDIRELKGAFKKMPVTMTVFSVGALSMIGIPPTCGFFSKWYLIGSGIEANNWIYVVALLISSFANAVIFFRIFENACFGTTPTDSDHAHNEDQTVETKTADAPLLLLLPAIISAITIILLGVFSQNFIEMFQITVEQINIRGGLS